MARGFTLLELLIYMSIFSLLAGLSVAALEPLVARFRAQESASEAYEAVVRARALARGSARCVRVEVVADPSGASLSTAAEVAAGSLGNGLRLMRWSSADCENSTDATVVEAVPMPSGASVRLKAGSPRLIFRTTGRPRDGQATLEVLREGEEAPSARVVVAPPGPTCLLPPDAAEACP